MSSMRAAICATRYVMCVSVCAWGRRGCRGGIRHRRPMLRQEEGGLGGGSSSLAETCKSRSDEKTLSGCRLFFFHAPPWTGGIRNAESHVDEPLLPQIGTEADADMIRRFSGDMRSAVTLYLYYRRSRSHDDSLMRSLTIRRARVCVFKEHIRWYSYQTRYKIEFLCHLQLTRPLADGCTCEQQARCTWAETELWAQVQVLHETVLPRL